MDCVTVRVRDHRVMLCSVCATIVGQCHSDGGILHPYLSKFKLRVSEGLITSTIVCWTLNLLPPSLLPSLPPGIWPRFRMLSGELPDKSYADKAVQTENVPTFDLLLDTGDAAEKDLSSKESRVVANELKVQEPLEAECTHPDSSIYLEAPLVNLHDSGEDQITSMASTCRAYSSGLSYRTLKTTSSRIVSLPETSSTFSAKTLLVKTSARVVSNPEHGGLIAQSQDSSGSCDSLDGSVDTDPYVSESQAREPLCSRSLATDAPYTPSPPSSPDSVVIIADKTELPRGFLRNKVALDNSMPSLRRDEEGSTQLENISYPRYMLTVVDRMDHVDQISSKAYPCPSRTFVLAICAVSLVS